jgi:hypothetical protein
MAHSYTNLPHFAGLIAMLAAADCGSFSAATDELGITHGSVSRRIAQVERWVGDASFRAPRARRFIVPGGPAIYCDGQACPDDT